MSGHDNFDEDAAHRTDNAPYSPRHPVPTVQRYQGHKEERQAVADAQSSKGGAKSKSSDGEHQGLLQSTKKALNIGDSSKGKATKENQPYRSTNRNVEDPAEITNSVVEEGNDEASVEEPDEVSEESNLKDTSEAVGTTLDPRLKRKNMKHMERDSTSREVTDPVTHLKVKIHDVTDAELNNVPENEPPPNSLPRNTTGTSMGSKSQTELDRESKEQQSQHSSMEKLFPPPNFEIAREEMTGTYTFAFTVGLCAILIISIFGIVGSLIIFQNTRFPKSWQGVLLSSTLFALVVGGIGGCAIWGLRVWLSNKLSGVWNDELWAAALEQENSTANSPIPESTQWLNSLLSSVWSLINPDLFTSLADTLEDVMQASLPKLVRMISVEDIGQGNESLRILGIRWLPTGAAAMSVSEKGTVTVNNGEQENDRKVPGEGEIDDVNSSDGDKDSDKGAGDNSEKSEEEQQDLAIKEGMEAEEGDFVNIEVAFSYRASNSGKSLRKKSKNAHLYLAFYLPGKIRLRKLSPLNCQMSIFLLTIFSCMGGASRNSRHHAYALTIMSGSTILCSCYDHPTWATQGRSELCSLDEERTQHHGLTSDLVFCAKLYRCGPGRICSS